MSEKIKRIVGDNLKTIRFSQNIGISVMADFLEIPSSTLEAYLYRRSIPPLGTVIKICTRFRYPINSFFAALLPESIDQRAIMQINTSFQALPELKRKQAYQIIAPMADSMLDGIPHLAGSGFGQRIRILREDSSMPLQSTAKSCGIAADTLKVLESNQRLPSLTTFLEICKALRVSPEYLLSDQLEHLSVDKGFYLFTIRQLTGLAETAQRLSNLYVEQAR